MQLPSPAQQALTTLAASGLGDLQVAKLFGVKPIAISLIRSGSVHLNLTGRTEKLMNSTGTTKYLEDHIVALGQGMSPDLDGVPKHLPRDCWGAA